MSKVFWDTEEKYSEKNMKKKMSGVESREIWKYKQEKKKKS